MLIIVVDGIPRGKAPWGMFCQMTEKNTVIIGIGNLILRDEGLGCHGEVAIIGVEPKEISWGMGLSPEVEATVPKVIDAILEELK